MHFDQELDAKGLKCPLPILRTKKLLSAMASGAVLHILTTDPGSVRDFQAFPNKPAIHCSQPAKSAPCTSFSSSANSPQYTVGAGLPAISPIHHRG